MLHFADIFLSGSRRLDALHRRRPTKHAKLTEESLVWLPKFTLTAESIEDIRRPHACRQYLVTTRPAASESGAECSPVPASAMDVGDSCYTTADDKPACVVCLEEYLAGQQVRVLHCGHVFHDECISEWLVRSKAKFHECPICKVPCFPEEVVKKAEHDARRRSSRRPRGNLVSVF